MATRSPAVAGRAAAAAAEGVGRREEPAVDSDGGQSPARGPGGVVRLAGRSGGRPPYRARFFLVETFQKSGCEGEARAREEAPAGRGSPRRGRGRRREAGLGARRARGRAGVPWRRDVPGFAWGDRACTCVLDSRSLYLSLYLSIYHTRTRQRICKYRHKSVRIHTHAHPAFPAPARWEGRALKGSAIALLSVS